MTSCRTDRGGNPWTDKGDMPHQRAGHAAFALGGNIYLNGGYDDYAGVKPVQRYKYVVGGVPPFLRLSTWIQSRQRRFEMGLLGCLQLFQYVKGVRVFGIDFE